MDRINKLLQSTVTEDIALGLFLMSKKGLITDNCMVEVNYVEHFVIRVDGYSGWTTLNSENKSCVHFLRGENVFSWKLTFDFRTKEEI